MEFPSNNPLAKHFRQPKLFIKLPSNGNFYPHSSLQKTETNEYPVLAMTAKDELMIKTPDALLNGQATVNVIQSCIPNIKDAWHIPSIDVDAILIAIRMATYGEKLEVEVDVPNINVKRSYDVDLRMLLDQLNTAEYENIIFHNDFAIEIQPTTYKDFTNIALKTFEEQRIFKIVEDDEMSELEKLNRFTESFERLTTLNVDLVSKSIVAIKYKDEPAVIERSYIDEFMKNCDKDFFQAVLDHIEKQKKKFSIKPIEVTTADEDRAAGAPDSFLMPIAFDQSHFFG